MNHKKSKIAVSEISRALFWVMSHEIFAAVSVFLIYYVIIKFLYDNFLSHDQLGILGIIWLFVSILVSLVNFFLNLRTFKNKGVFVTPVIPSLISGVFFVLLEIIFLTFTINFVQALTTPSLNANLTLIMVVFSFEILRRQLKVLNVFQRILFALSNFIKSTFDYLGESWATASFWLISFGFVVISSFLLRKGFTSPLIYDLNYSGELFPNVLTIVMGILAIFFTAITLSIQLIIGTYSYGFVKVLIKAPIFLSCFLIYLIIGGIHLVCLRFGWNVYLANFSLASSIYTLISFIILLRHFADWVQIPYVITVATKNLKNYVNSIKKPKLRVVQPSQKERKISLKHRIRSYLLTAFLGERYKDPYLEELTDYNFPINAQKKIIENIRPILTTCLKAVNEDRREVVLACLKGVKEVVQAYIDRFGSSIYMQDDFFMFLNDQLSIIYESAVDSKNPQYTSDIVETVLEIAKSCLVLTQPVTKENNHIFIWVMFLKESVQKSLHLERTSAPMMTCTGLTEIGNLLIQQNAYSTTLHVVAEALYDIGKNVGRIKHMWTAAIAVRVTGKLMELLANYMIEAWKSNLYYEFFVRGICNKIFEIADLAYKNQSHDVWTITNISNSVVRKDGGLNISGLASIVLMNWSENPSRSHYMLMKDIREIIFLVNRLWQSAITVKAYTIEEYCSTLAQIGYMLVNFIVGQEKDKETIELAKKDLKLVVSFAENMVASIVKQESNNIYESLNEISFLYGSLLYSSGKSEKEFLLSMYSESLRKLLELFNGRSKSELENRGYRTLYSYIKLFSAWQYYFAPQDALNKNLKTFLRQKTFLRFFMEQSDYPDYFTSSDWRSIGWNAWGLYGEETIKFFRNMEIYSNYAGFLKKEKRKTRNI